MKVKFKFGIKTYSGTVDEMTFGAYRNGNICIGRKYVTPKLTENNTLRGTTMKNLASIFRSLSSGYKDDLKVYATANIIHVPKNKMPPSTFSIFVKMMYLFTELDEGHIELSTVTYSDLQTVGTDIGNIATAVINGYLPSVPGAAALISNM